MKGQWTSTHYSAETSHTDPINDIVGASSVDSDKWVYITKGMICVTSPAQGGGGKLRLRSTDGADILLEMDVNAVKEVPLDFGDVGLRLTNQDVGVQALVYGAATKQATVFISLIAHVARRAE